MHTPTNTDTEKPCGELDINETLRQMIQNGMLNEALDFCKVFVKNGHINKEIYIFYVLLLIRQKELENHQPQTFEVVAIDGLLMATCQDIPQREDLFTGWDFYDISQSEEFRRAGYKVVVPRQDTAWVIHDDDLLNLSDYNYWKDIYLKEYRRNADQQLLLGWSNAIFCLFST